MGRSVPMKYLRLETHRVVVFQDFFWVIKPANRSNKICVIDQQLMIFSSAEKALSFIDTSNSRTFVTEVLFWHEIVFCGIAVSNAVLDCGSNREEFNIWINLDSERKELAKMSKGIAK